MGHEQLTSAASRPIAEADVLGALVVGVLDDFLEAPRRLAVHLLSEAFAALDDLANEIGQLQMLKSLDRLFSDLNAQVAVVALARRQQPFDELNSRGTLAVRDELHPDTRTPRRRGARRVL